MKTAGERRDRSRGLGSRFGARAAVLVAVLCGGSRSSAAIEPASPVEPPVELPVEPPVATTRVVIALDPGVVEFTPAAMTNALRGHLPGMTPQVEMRAVDGGEHDGWVNTQLLQPDTRAVVWIERDDEMGLRVEVRLPRAEGVAGAEGAAGAYGAAGAAGAAQAEGIDSWSRRVPVVEDPVVLLEELGAMLGGMLVLDPTPLAAPEPEARPVAPPAEPPVAPLAEPIPVPAPEPSWSADLWLGYSGAPLAPTARWTHGAMLESGLWLRSNWWLGLGLGWVPPQRVSAPGDVRVQRIPVHLAGGHRFLRGRRFQPAVFALARLEALGWSPAQGDAVLGRRGWAARVALGVGLDARIQLGRGVFGSIRATAHGWLLNSTVVVVEPAGSRVILQAYPISGALVAGVGYAWGRS